MMFKIIPPSGRQPKLGVFGVGGCGNNTVSALAGDITSDNVTFYNINTDIAALEHCPCGESILIGEQLTNGYGAGSDPAVGLKAAQESEQLLRPLFTDNDVIIITTGLGGGTGTGASPFLAKLAAEYHKPCIAVVTLPFNSEGAMRKQYAEAGYLKLNHCCSALVSLPNDNLILALGTSIGIFDAFSHSNSLLKNIISALIDMLISTGHMNVDLNDFSTIMSHQGEAVLGIGRSDNEQDIEEAIDLAIKNPLSSNVALSQAQGVILQINCREQVEMGTYEKITNSIHSKVANTALIISGLAHHPEQKDYLEILVIATGLNSPKSINYNHAENQNKTAIDEKHDYFDIPAFLRNNSLQ